MPRGWSEVFSGSIAWRVRLARRAAAWLTAVHVLLGAVLAVCWGRWPWAHLVELAGVAASVSLWSGLYQARAALRGDAQAWRAVTAELPDVEPPLEGEGGLLLHGCPCCSELGG